MMENNSTGRAVRRETGRGSRPGERAVSEIVSIVLLLAVVVMGVGLVTVTIYSQPAPERTPQVDILVSEKDGIISLTHNGGDPLANGTFYVLADGVPLGDPISPSGSAGTWSIGEVVQYDGPSDPGQVQVVYGTGGGAVLLKSATFSGAAGTAGPDVPVGPTEGGTYVSPSFDSQDKLDDWVVDQFVEQLARGNTVYLSQDPPSSGTSAIWDYSGAFEITLNDSNTYLELDGDGKLTFPTGDVLRIALSSAKQSTMRFFAIGHGGWHISADSVTVSNSSETWGSGSKAKIVSGRIYGYRDFTSSVTIKAPNGNPTEFYINNSLVISGTLDSDITLTNIRPANPTLMILDISNKNNEPCYYVGTADITYNPIP